MIDVLSTISFINTIETRLSKKEIISDRNYYFLMKSFIDELINSFFMVLSQIRMDSHHLLFYICFWFRFQYPISTEMQYNIGNSNNKKKDAKYPPSPGSSSTEGKVIENWWCQTV